jgi:cytochrome c peroxidase
MASLAAAALVLGVPTAASPLSPPDGGDVKPLSAVPVPRPSNLRDFVKNDAKAVALGKALFWESQTGGDGIQACATCHFSAGADSRTTNTAHPGPNGIFEEVALAGTITANRFPIQSDDVLGSQGVVDKSFNKIIAGTAQDDGTVTPNATFLDNRQVTGRNTPTSINSVFNFETFWDGRAKNTFNGRNPGGRDPTALLLRVGSGGSLSKVTVEIRNSAAASQAVGPPNNGVEMSWDGRAFFDLGKKLLALQPLGLQQVASDDSVLGPLRHASGMGLNTGYADLIRAAFEARWWDSNAIVDRNLNVVGSGTPSGLDQFSVMEANFSLFWGLAIQMYMSTLVSGDSPFDRFAKGSSSALTSLQKQGMNVFIDKGRCDHCHQRGGMFTEAVEGTGGDAFAQTGVRPAANDPGRAGEDPGRFKTATIRNTELTGPYFHNGDKATLRQVVDFYDRGGDFPNPELQRLGLSESQKVALVAFLLSTTDDRVRFQRAPFDHPSLSIPNGISIPAVGKNGGAQIQTFLGLDPFASSTGFAPMVVADTPGTLAQGGSVAQAEIDQSVTLISYVNSGKDFRLFAAVDGSPLDLPESGIQAPTRDDLLKLAANHKFELVATGTFDSIGTASVPVDRTLGAYAPELFFAVMDPASHRLLAISGATRLPLVP